MGSGCLLCEAGCRWCQPALDPIWPKWFNAKTASAAQKRRVLRGLHPTGRELGPGGRCKTCRHLVRNQQANVYLKCNLDRARWTGGNGTDIRAGWPGCAGWAHAPKPWRGG